MSAFFDAALQITSERGWSVFPVSRETKVPCIQGGRNAASTDLDTLIDWGDRFPTANVGVPTGPENNIFVLDFDTPESINALSPFGRMPKTLEATSGRGRHMYFFHMGGRIVNRAGKMVLKSQSQFRPDVWLDVPGLDVRGDGGSIIVPPSVHKNGNRYAWVDASTPVAMPHPWLLRMLGEKCEARYFERPETVKRPPELDRVVGLVRGSQKGSRNHTLNGASFLAGKGIRMGGYDRASALCALLHAALAIGLDRKEAMQTINSGLNAGLSK